MSHDDGRHDFDFFFGSWRSENRKRVNMVVQGDDEWVEFPARIDARPIIGGLGNIDTFSAPDFPGRPGFEAFTLRLFEPKTGLWRIWWASPANPADLGEPVVGRFEDGVGIFECDDILEGVHIRVRYTWKDITEDSVTWEQSFSFDGRRTWEPNWTIRSTRIADYVQGLVVERKLVVA
jgi:hypothetical protein